MSRLFNGSTDTIITSSVPTVARDVISMAFWIWQVSYAGASQVIMYNGNTNSNGWGFYTSATNLNFLLGGIGQSSYTLPTVAVWTHIAAVNTGALGHANWVIYINGSPQSAYNPSDLTVPTGSMSLGANFGSFFDNCRLADAAIWNAVLTDGEVSALANGARPGMIEYNNLAIWLPLEGLTSPEPDLSGNVMNGTLTGTAFAPGPPLMTMIPRWGPQYFASAPVTPWIPIKKDRRNWLIRRGWQ